MFQFAVHTARRAFFVVTLLNPGLVPMNRNRQFLLTCGFWHLTLSGLPPNIHYDVIIGFIIFHFRFLHPVRNDRSLETGIGINVLSRMGRKTHRSNLHSIPPAGGCLRHICCLIYAIFDTVSIVVLLFIQFIQVHFCFAIFGGFYFNPSLIISTSLPLRFSPSSGHNC